MTEEMADPIADAYALIVGTKLLASEDPAHVYRTFRDVFGNEAGRRVIAWMCREACIMVTQNESVAPEAVKEDLVGRRHMVQWILRHYSIPPPAPKAEEKQVSPLDRR